MSDSNIEDLEKKLREIKKYANKRLNEQDKPEINYEKRLKDIEKLALESKQALEAEDSLENGIDNQEQAYIQEEWPEKTSFKEKYLNRGEGFFKKIKVYTKIATGALATLAVIGYFIYGLVKPEARLDNLIADFLAKSNLGDYIAGGILGPLEALGLVVVGDALRNRKTEPENILPVSVLGGIAGVGVVGAYKFIAHGSLWP